MNTMLYKANIRQRILMILLAIMLLIGLTPQTAFAGAGDIKVIIDFEGYNLGQGFYIEPTELTLPVGSTAADATKALLTKTGHASEGLDSNYLGRVQGFDTSELNVPSYITDNGGPTTEDAIAHGKSDSDWLGQMDYSDMSGWMYTVNNDIANEGIGDYILTDGDVIRWQFSLWDFGADLGISADWFTPYFTMADKSALIRAICEPDVDTAKANAALDVVINPLATSEQVTAALDYFVEEVVEPEVITVNAWAQQDDSGF
ncbi:MAG: DUF4430 domain-containing protein, partial [Clostridiales Family XIII bacterium]|nr:DUF4430 domain-containing protein [Clostridiales Family XIII bacterium]